MTSIVSVGFHNSVDIAVCLTLGVAVALVVKLLTDAKSNFHFNSASREIKGEWNESVSLASDETEELEYLLFVHQELFWAKRIAVKDVALLVRADVNAVCEHLAVINAAKGILEVDSSAPNALDFGAEKLDSRLVGVLDEVIVAGFFVLRYYLFGFFFVRHDVLFSFR